MSTVSEAVEALEAALQTVPGIRTYTDPQALIDPPGAVILPPDLTWSVFGAEPTEATFPVALVVAVGDSAMPNLWDLIPLVSQALNSLPNAAVRRAEAIEVPTGGVRLPAYVFSVEVVL